MIPFVWRDGVHLAGSALWCDARRARSLCFLSHAGRRPAAGRGQARPRQLLCTEGTERLLGLLEGVAPEGAHPSGDVLRCPYGRPFSLGALRLELFPSGYLPGAASLLVTLQAGQRPLVYAGDLNPRGVAGAEPMQVRGAEAVVCHAPLAALGRPLPERAEAEAALLDRLARSLDEGACAVVLAPELGPAQELALLLAAKGLPLLVHPRVLRPLPAFSPPAATPPAIEAFSPRHGPRRGAVILWPLERPLGPLCRAARAQGPLRLHLCLCAGASLSEEATARYRRALPEPELPLYPLPFPDGLDLPGLLRYVAASEARQVYLTAGAGEVVARALSSVGVTLAPLGPPRQLDLFGA